jgi:hypothetical protein
VLNLQLGYNNKIASRELNKDKKLTFLSFIKDSKSRKLNKLEV